MIFEKIKKFIKDKFGNTLYFPGCLTRIALKEILENWLRILEILEIDFIFPEEFYCCGSPCKSLGYFEEYDYLKNKNKELFEKLDVNKIITNCPACYSNLKVQGFNVIFSVNLVLDKLKENKRLIKSFSDELISYHDPCHLGRYSNIYDEPRELLKLLGFKLIEPFRTRENSFCCGAGGNLRNFNNEVSNKIALNRLEEFKKLGIKKIVTCCPMCYFHLKENSKRFNLDLDVKEISEVILDAIE